jgi:serine/threonine-protein kinase RsbW
MTEVELTVPASPRHIRAARLVAASLASDIGFDVERLEDVKVAVDEMCSLFRGNDSETINLVFTVDDRQLSVRGHYEGNGEVVRPDWLVREILESLTDDHELPTDETRRFRLTCGMASHEGD